MGIQVVNGPSPVHDFLQYSSTYEQPCYDGSQMFASQDEPFLAAVDIPGGPLQTHLQPVLCDGPSFNPQDSQAGSTLIVTPATQYLSATLDAGRPWMHSDLHASTVRKCRQALSASLAHGYTNCIGREQFITCP